MWGKSTEAKPSSSAVDQQHAQVPSKSPHTPPPVPVPVQLPSSAPAFSTASQEHAGSSAAQAISRFTSGIKIHGEISGSSDLYIDGVIEGKVRLTSARVTVGPNGRLEADVEAREIVVDGSVRGNLKAGDSVHFGASSRVDGSVLAVRIGVADGARLRGKMETIRATQARESLPAVSNPEPLALLPVSTSLGGE